MSELAVASEQPDPQILTSERRDCYVLEYSSEAYIKINSTKSPSRDVDLLRGGPKSFGLLYRHQNADTAIMIILPETQQTFNIALERGIDVKDIILANDGLSVTVISLHIAWRKNRCEVIAKTYDLQGRVLEKSVFVDELNIFELERYTRTSRRNPTGGYAREGIQARAISRTSDYLLLTNSYCLDGDDDDECKGAFSEQILVFNNHRRRFQTCHSKLLPRRDFRPRDAFLSWTGFLWKGVRYYLDLVGEDEDEDDRDYCSSKSSSRRAAGVTVVSVHRDYEQTQCCPTLARGRNVLSTSHCTGKHTCSLSGLEASADNYEQALIRVAFKDDIYRRAHQRAEDMYADTLGNDSILIVVFEGCIRILNFEEDVRVQEKIA